MTRLSTGIGGLDEILHGGLLPGQVYLVKGRPGAGKTTLALQFLLEAIRRGEPALYVTLNESEAELRAAAAAHGWDLGDLEILEILPGDEDLSPESQYSVFHPGDVELAPTTRKITEAMERHRPARVAFDSLTEVRLLSRDSVRYRRQVLALKEFLRSRGATALFLGESTIPSTTSRPRRSSTASSPWSRSWGPTGWTGARSASRSIAAATTCRACTRRGSSAGASRSTLAWSPPCRSPCSSPRRCRAGSPGWTGCSAGAWTAAPARWSAAIRASARRAWAMAFLAAAAARGERGCSTASTSGRPRSSTVARRSAWPSGRRWSAALLRVQKVNPLGLPPEQFCNWVRVEVEHEGTRLVMIDTVNGYELCTRDKVGFLSHLQQLVGLLKSRGVSLILVNEIAKVTGELTMAETGMSFIADNSVLIKAFEDGGALRKAIGVTRKRLGPHDDRFHEYRVTPHGLHIGGPLTQLRGILGGEADRGRNPAGSPREPAAGPSDG